LNKNSIRRLVLDVLKPHNPPTPVLAKILASMDGVDGVNISLIEVDAETETVKITIEGPDLDFDSIKKKIEECGAKIHSIDQVVAGRIMVEEVDTEHTR